MQKYNQQDSEYDYQTDLRLELLFKQLEEYGVLDKYKEEILEKTYEPIANNIFDDIKIPDPPKYL